MRFQHAFPVWALVILFGHVLHGSTLKGVVRGNRADGPQISDVLVKARGGGANQTTTDNRGTFTLEFPAHSAGEMVDLEVEKAGYAVVNYLQLRCPLPKTATEDGLVIILCPVKEFAVRLREFWVVRISESIETHYQERRRELVANQRATHAAQALLRAEREQALGGVRRAAEEWSSLDPNQISDLNAEALRLVLTGRIDEAIRTLDRNVLRKAMEEVRKEKAQIAAKQAAVLQSYLSRVRALSMRFRFGEAAQTYEEALSYAPDNFALLEAYGDFLVGRNHHPNAIELFHRAEGVARRSENPEDLARVLGELGSAYLFQNRVKEAEKAYREVMPLFQRLYGKPSAIVPEWFVGTIYNFGNFLLDQGNVALAQNAYEDALKGFRQLAVINSVEASENVAMTQCALAGLHHSQRRFKESEEAYQEALSIRRKLAKEHPSRCEGLALTLSNRGLHLHEQKRHAEAEPYLLEARDIRLGLVKEDPEAYIPGLGKTMRNLGDVYAALGRNEEAIRMLRESEGIFRKLAKEEPESFEKDLAMVLCTLAKILRHQRRPREACPLLEESRSILRKYVIRNSDDISRRLAMASGDLAMVYAELGMAFGESDRMPEANLAINEAVGIFRDLAGRNAAAFLDDFALTLERSGMLKAMQRQFESGIKDLQEALGLFERLAKEDPQRFSESVENEKELLRRARQEALRVR